MLSSLHPWEVHSDLARHPDNITGPVYTNRYKQVDRGRFSPSINRKIQHNSPG